MQLKQAVQNVFVQLSETIDQLSDEQYIHPCCQLKNASIGQHVRHIIELCQELEKGYESGVVNYEKRIRDHVIETNRAVAKDLLGSLFESFNKPDKNLTLEVCYDTSSEVLHIATNYHREIAYNLEHTIHHMALIRIGINEVSQLSLPEEFGVASSTMKYRKNVHSNLYQG
jgi:hypothetical protein